MRDTLPALRITPLRMETLVKVPEITILFWVVKLLTTAMGESTSDYLVYHINPYVAVVAGCVGLVVSLILQFAVRRYIPWVYWLAIVMVAIFGTMAADVLHVVLGIPYLDSTIFFAASLVVIFAVWYMTEKTLSIHSIYTPRREIFYWATVMATFALGTAAGDLTAATLGLGYFASGILFAILFVAPYLAYRLFGLNGIAAFWFSYVMTRPLGASFADWFGKPYFGGLGLGDTKVALVLTILIIIGVGYLTVTYKGPRKPLARPDDQPMRRHSNQPVAPTYNQPDPRQYNQPVAQPYNRQPGARQYNQSSANPHNPQDAQSFSEQETQRYPQVNAPRQRYDGYNPGP